MQNDQLIEPELQVQVDYISAQLMKALDDGQFIGRPATKSTVGCITKVLTDLLASCPTPYKINVDKSEDIHNKNELIANITWTIPNPIVIDFIVSDNDEVTFI